MIKFSYPYIIFDNEINENILKSSYYIGRYVGYAMKKFSKRSIVVICPEKENDAIIYIFSSGIMASGMNVELYENFNKKDNFDFDIEWKFNKHEESKLVLDLSKMGNKLFEKLEKFVLNGCVPEVPLAKGAEVGKMFRN